MNSNDIMQIASNAQMIVNGYAFTMAENGTIRVVYLHEPHHALVMSNDGKVLETSMDDIEIEIVQGYWTTNKKTLDKVYA